MSATQTPSVTAFVAGAFTAGVWFGGDPYTLFAGFEAAAVLSLLGAMVLPWADRKTGLRSVLIAISLLAAGPAGCVVGASEASRVFNQSYHQREEIRAAVHVYYDVNGNYPATLDEAGVRPPTQILRGPLLRYRKTIGGGYVMWFGDSMVEHRASNESAWMAVK